MVRFLADNGKPNDNILMHILSPYPKDRSAITDCGKLAESGLEGKKAILIYGFDHEDWPLDHAIEAFEALAAKETRLGNRIQINFEGLAHPIHSNGKVFAWEISPK